MIDGESRAIAIAVLAGTIVVPLVGSLLSRRFPPEPGTLDVVGARKYRFRNQVIEVCGVAFLMLGLALPFLWAGQSSLDPTLGNSVLIICSGLIVGIAGIRLLTICVGDLNADCFLTYFELEHRISAQSVRSIARVLFGSAIFVSIVVLIIQTIG